MTKRYLDLRDRLAIIDFLDANVGYLPAPNRKPYERVVADAMEGKKMTTERLADFAKNLAAATWAERRAIAQVLIKERAEAEWEALCEAVRPTTKLLLVRLHKNAGAANVNTVLSSSDAALAIHEAEETEIALLRPQIRMALWEKFSATLSTQVAAAEEEMEAMRKRFKKLRDMANKSSSVQELLSGKLEDLEDRVYFGGEAIPVEALDAELRFDAGDVEIPPTDDALLEAETLPPKFIPMEEEQERQGERDTEEMRQEEKEEKKLES